MAEEKKKKNFVIVTKNFVIACMRTCESERKGREKGGERQR